MKEDGAMPLIFARPFLATAKVKINIFKRVISVKAYGERIKINMPEWKEKKKEHEDAFLADMMMVWSDESLESFFRKEGTSKKKELPPLKKEPLPVVKEKQPAAEKKPPLVVKKKQLGMEQDKKKGHPWITKLWKEKEVPYSEIKAYANYIGSKTFGHYNEAEFDKYTSLDAEQEGYNPG